MTGDTEPAMVKEVVMDALAVAAGLGLIDQDMLLPGWLAIAFAAVSAAAQWFGVRQRVASPDTHRQVKAQRDRYGHAISYGLSHGDSPSLRLALQKALRDTREQP